MAIPFPDLFAALPHEKKKWDQRADRPGPIPEDRGVLILCKADVLNKHADLTQTGT